MPFWREIDEALDVSATLRDLDDGQAESVVTVFVMVIHADARVLPLEVAGIHHLLFELPGLDARHERVRGWVAEAARRAEAARDEEALRALAAEAAAGIEGQGLRERVFAMAVALARVDLKLDPIESRALHAVAEAFGIERSKAETLIRDGYR